MFDLFADIFTYRQNALVKADPRVKLMVALWAVVLILLSSDPLFPLTVLCISVITLLLLRVPPKIIALRLMIPIGMVIVIVVLKLFMIAGEPLFTLPWPKVPLTATVEGLRAGTAIASRVIAAVAVIVLLGVTTPAHELFRSLLWMKAPREWVEVALLMYRYIFVLIETSLNIASAQKLRLGYTGFRRSLRSLGALSGMVILHSVDQSSRTAEAMSLRGYDGTMPAGMERPWRGIDGAVLFSLCAMLGAVYGALEWVL